MKTTTKAAVLVCSLASLSLITLKLAPKVPQILVSREQQTIHELQIVRPCP